MQILEQKGSHVIYGLRMSGRKKKILFKIHTHTNAGLGQF